MEVLAYKSINKKTEANAQKQVSSHKKTPTGYAPTKEEIIN